VHLDAVHILDLRVLDLLTQLQFFTIKHKRDVRLGRNFILIPKRRLDLLTRRGLAAQMSAMGMPKTRP